MSLQWSLHNRYAAENPAHGILHCTLLLSMWMSVIIGLEAFLPAMTSS